MRSAGYSVTENDPFQNDPAIIFDERKLSAYVNRMRVEWAVIPIESRSDYMASLEEASVKQNIVPFTKFIADLVVKEAI